MINPIQDEHRRRHHDRGRRHDLRRCRTDGLGRAGGGRPINAIANPQLPKVGERYLGTVVKTTAFGAFVSLLPGRDGLVHISQAAAAASGSSKVEDVVKVGDKMQVEINEIDARGKISLMPVGEAELAPVPSGRRRRPSAARSARPDAGRTAAAARCRRPCARRTAELAPDDCWDRLR